MAGQYATTAEVHDIFDKLMAEVQGVRVECFRYVDDSCTKLHGDVHALRDSICRHRVDIGNADGIVDADLQTGSGDTIKRFQKQLDGISVLQSQVEKRLQAQDVELTEVRERTLRGLEERCSILTTEVWAQGRELRESVERLTVKLQCGQPRNIGVDYASSDDRADAIGNPAEPPVLRELHVQDVNTNHSLPMTPELSPRAVEPLKPRSRRRTTIFRLPHDQGTVRIPRCTAPPTAFRELPTAAISEPANPVWDDFGDQSDDDGILTPPVAGPSSSFTPPDADSSEQDGYAHEEHEKSLITPDGIPIMLMEGSCEVEMEGVEGCTANPAMEIVAGPTGFRPPRKSRLSIVLK